MAAGGRHSQSHVRGEELSPMFEGPSMFQNSTNTQISGGTFVVNSTHYHAGQTAMEVVRNGLKEHVIPSATHDTNDVADPPKCHPGTRVALLERIMHWVQAFDGPTHVSWLSGPAGSGKTAIMRSLVELLDAQGISTATFFLFKLDPQRNSTKSLIATLAYQLVRAVPDLLPYIANAIVDDPLLCHRSLETQFDKLVVHPISQLSSPSSSQPPSPMIILIDGLDECGDRDARCLLLKKILAGLPHFSGRLKFLIASRPEPDIKNVFEHLELKRQTNFIELLSDLRAYEDVRVYLQDNFDEIKRTHLLRDSFARAWPSADDIETLVKKSSGYFIYASTVMKYIKVAYDRPEDRLETVLGLRTTTHTALADLDVLYHHVLSQSRYDHQAIANILAAYLVCQDASIAVILPSEVFSSNQLVEDLLTLRRGDVQLALLDIQSLVALKGISGDRRSMHTNTWLNGTTAIPPPRIITFEHKSFSEFLRDPVRSKDFYVPVTQIATTVAKGCLHVLGDEEYFSEKFWRQYGTPRDTQATNKSSPNVSKWEGRSLYHLILARACKLALCDDALVQSMLDYNSLDFLSLAVPHVGREDVWVQVRQRFAHYLEFLECFESASAFKNTPVFQYHCSLLDDYLRQNLSAYLPDHPIIMHYITVSILEGGISAKDHGPIRSRAYEMLKEKSAWGRSWFEPVEAGEIPHFLFWLFGSFPEHRNRLNASRYICDFFHSKKRAGEYHIGDDKLDFAATWALEELRTHNPSGPESQRFTETLLMRLLYHPKPLLAQGRDFVVYFPRFCPIIEHFKKESDFSHVIKDYDSETEDSVPKSPNFFRQLVLFDIANLNVPLETNPLSPFLKIPLFVQPDRFWETVFWTTSPLQDFDSDVRRQILDFGRQLSKSQSSPQTGLGQRLKKVFSF